ncbi:esterase [Fervidobacterium thailandense]|uniref:Esterase n=2 Tax=Fervidobacterium thailandense TaxID=1008305 RepID=A0A1E3G3Y5_9BACT|nr:esterase [Fervidobacterium thailandense]
MILTVVSATKIFGYKVTFIVEVPTYTPDDAEIFIAGNFNGWNPGDPRFRLYREGWYYVGTFELSGRIEFKFTRGSWETVEKGSRGEEIANRVLEIQDDMEVKLVVMHWRDFVEKGKAGMRKTYTGNIKLIENFYSPELGNYRNIIIYLPPDYESSTERYPVLYMHDGQNIFDKSTSFSGIEWEADESAERLIKEGAIRPIIIVGIYNTGVERRNEYSPWVDENYGGGKGDLYAKFIVETLKPYIDANFRTLPDRENTAICGSSMGGLISLYIGLKHNDVFSMLGVMSPAFWFANKKIFDYVKENEFQYPTKIYMDVGTAEGSNPEVYLFDARNMNKLLQMKKNVDLLYLEDRNAPHSESAWARRFPELLMFFFGKE